MKSPAMSRRVNWEGDFDASKGHSALSFRTKQS